MNNSFPRLIDGMIATIRQEVVPHTEGEFARGQAFGVIYMLEMMKRRADWSPSFLSEQLDALAELASEIDGLDLQGAPPLPSRSGTSDADSMIQERNAGDAGVCDLIQWLVINPNAQAQAAVDNYIKRQLRHEITTSARPMFAEISLGRDVKEA